MTVQIRTGDQDAAVQALRWVGLTREMISIVPGADGAAVGLPEDHVVSLRFDLADREYADHARRRLTAADVDVLGMQTRNVTPQRNWPLGHPLRRNGGTFLGL
ncbi:MAG TPA: hypothetical protein VHJ17_13485 [Thermomonospora sp.]|nr:hypothetical protein [Thermomonospora sp.]